MVMRLLDSFESLAKSLRNVRGESLTSESQSFHLRDARNTCTILRVYVYDIAGLESHLDEVQTTFVFGDARITTKILVLFH